MITRWNRPYTVTRETAKRTFVKGREVPGATEQIQIQATIQPMTPREIMKLPEGERSQEMIKIYTATELNIGKVDGLAGDIIDYDGNQYEVIGVDDWNKQNGIKHFKVRGSKIDPEAGNRQQ